METTKERFYEYTQSLGIPLNDAQRLMAIAYTLGYSEADYDAENTFIKGWNEGLQFAADNVQINEGAEGDVPTIDKLSILNGMR